MRSMVPSVLLAVLTAACATGATHAPVTAGTEPRMVESATGFDVFTRNDYGGTSQTVDAPLDRVRAALPEVFQAIGVTDAGMDAAGLVFGNRTITAQHVAGERPAAWVRCGSEWGSGPAAARYRPQLSLLITLRPEGERTLVTTEVGGSATPIGGAGTGPVTCVSNGKLERKVADALAARLAPA